MAEAAPKRPVSDQFTLELLCMVYSDSAITNSISSLQQLLADATDMKNLKHCNLPL